MGLGSGPLTHEPPRHVRPPCGLVRGPAHQSCVLRGHALPDDAARSVPGAPACQPAGTAAGTE